MRLAKSLARGNQTLQGGLPCQATHVAMTAAMPSAAKPNSNTGTFAKPVVMPRVLTMAQSARPPARGDGRHPCDGARIREDDRRKGKAGIEEDEAREEFVDQEDAGVRHRHVGRQSEPHHEPSGLPVDELRHDAEDSQQVDEPQRTEGIDVGFEVLPQRTMLPASAMVPFRRSPKWMWNHRM